MSSERNKTIKLTKEEAQEYSDPNIICGNLFDVIGDLPNDSFDLLLTDPPYNIKKDFGGFSFGRMCIDDYTRYTVEWLSAVLPKLKKTASIYICCDWRCSSEIKVAMEKLGIAILNRITWKREKGRGAKKNWKNVSEDIWFGVLDKNNYHFDLEVVKERKTVICPYRNDDGSNKDWGVDDDGNKFRLTCPPNVWTDIVVPFWSMPENTTHPTQKPEKLLERIIKASCPVGGNVLDVFAGSGSTLVAAKKLGMSFTGIEIDPYWCGIAAYRLKHGL